MSKYTRFGETGIQKKVIRIIEKEFNTLGVKIVGATTMGKNYDIVILYLSSHRSGEAGEVIVDKDGSFKIEESELDNVELEEITEAIEYEREKLRM